MLPPEMMPQQLLQDEIDTLVEEIARNTFIHSMVRDYVHKHPKKFNLDSLHGLNLLQSDRSLPHGIIIWLKRQLESYPFSLRIQNDPAQKLQKLKCITYVMTVFQLAGIKKTEQLSRMYEWQDFRRAYIFLEISREILYHCTPEAPCLLEKPPGGVAVFS